MALNKQKRTRVWCLEKATNLHDLKISLHYQYPWTDSLKYRRSPRNSDISKTALREKKSRGRYTDSVMINRRIKCPLCGKKFFLKIMRDHWDGDIMYKFPAHKKEVKIK